jgi:ketosteroid isomerase-like protein
MNVQPNTQLVLQIYESIKAGDIEALLKPFAEDVVWQLPEMENVPFAGTWHGSEGVRKFMGNVFEVQDIIEFEPEESFAKGDKVVC